MPSLWKAEFEPLPYPPLDHDTDCDLIVIGSGIAGLSSAFEAARFGTRVVVIDRAEICGGMTARTTAHLVSEIDDRYFDLIAAVGEEDSRLYYESQVAAINRVEAICKEEEIAADFARLPGYLVAADKQGAIELEREYDACRRIGVDVQWSDEAPVAKPYDGKALKFPNQGRMHPLKYCAGLALAIQKRDGRLFGGTAYVDHDESADGVIIRTESGYTIRAGVALFATNVPVNDRVKVHTKQVPMRTYVIASKVPSRCVEDALVWDTLQPYHYVRLQPAGDDHDWLIVGGGDHRSGTANDMEDRFGNLETWAQQQFPQFGNAELRWSGQVMEPVDFIPYSGRDDSDKVYIHSGDSGQGMTNGVAGALNFIALYRNDKAHFAELFNPSRKPKAGLTLGEYVKGQGPVVANLGEYLGAGEVADVREIPPGQGAVLRRGLSKHAVYRGDDGTLIERSAVCTHVGCIVHWNGFEKCWDCPCHGSQFLPDGTVINGPAVRPLATVDETVQRTPNETSHA